MPKHDGSLRHAYRRKWATERKHLPDVDVAQAGGWSDLASLKTAYQHTDAAALNRAWCASRPSCRRSRQTRADPSLSRFPMGQQEVASGLYSALTWLVR